MKPTTEMNLTESQLTEADQLAMYKRSRGVEQGFYEVPRVLIMDTW